MVVNEALEGGGGGGGGAPPYPLSKEARKGEESISEEGKDRVSQAGPCMFQPPFDKIREPEGYYISVSNR